MKKTPLVNVFNAGELGHYEDTRVDMKHYHEGCKTIENMLPSDKGPIRRMPGTYFVKEVGDPGSWPPPFGDVYWTTPTTFVETDDLEVMDSWIPYAGYTQNRAPVCTSSVVYITSWKATATLGYFSKFDVASRTFVATLAGTSGKSSQLVASVLDNTNGFLYVVNYSTGANSVLYKIRLSDFTLNATLTLSQNYAMAIAIDSTATFLYIAVNAGAAPLKVIKVSIATFAEVSTLSTTISGAGVWSKVSYIDSSFLYFATGAGGRKIEKVQLSDFTEKAVLTLAVTEQDIEAMVVYEGKMYCGTWTTPDAFLIQIDLSTFTKVTTLTLTGIPYINCGLQRWGYGLFNSTVGANSKMLWINLEDLTLDDSNAVAGYGNNWSGVVWPAMM